MRRCGTRFGNTVVTILPMQNKNFSGDPEEPNAVPGADVEAKKSLTLTSPQNLANRVKISPGTIARQRHTDWKQMGLLNEQCAE